MKLGLVCVASDTGLGYQTRDLYKHLKPAKTLLVDISGLNGKPIHRGWYPDAQYVSGFPNRGDINVFLEGLDVVLTVETPYNYYLFERAKELGVKTVNIYNYEFLDQLAKPWLPYPDVLAAPTKWHYEDVERIAKKAGIKHIFLQCPVDTDEFKYEPRTGKRFIHIAGVPAAHDRNGTEIVREANALGAGIEIIEYQPGMTRQEIYSRGDVLVLPRRYGGNCLPLWEALASGMGVIMPDVSPNKDYLPDEWLVPAKKTSEFMPRTVIDIYSVEPKDLVKAVNEFAHQPLTAYMVSLLSWEVWKPKYIEALEGLL